MCVNICLMEGCNGWGSTESWETVGSGSKGWSSSDGSGSSDGWSNAVCNSNSWSCYGVSNLSSLGVGACLVDGLFVGHFSSDGSDDGFSSKYWFLSKNRAG